MIRMIRSLYFVMVLFSGLLLSGCGGGGGSGGSGTAVSANGLWQGTFTENGIDTFDLHALLYNGRIIAISEAAGIIYDGRYSMDGNRITGSVTAYQIGGGVYTKTNLSGTVSAQNQITASFSTDLGTTGTINLVFDEIYNRDSSLGLVADVWYYSDGIDSLAINVENDGTFVGQSSDGCILSGRLSILDPAYNLYGVEVTVTNCGYLNGSYDGFAGLMDDTMPNDTLLVAVSNMNYVIIYSLSRQ